MQLSTGVAVQDTVEGDELKRWWVTGVDDIATTLAGDWHTGIL